MAMPLRGWAAMSGGKRAALRARAAGLLATLDAGGAI
jgi:hypothetical protein